LLADSRQSRVVKGDDLITSGGIINGNFPVDNKWKEGRVLTLCEKFVAWMQQ